jgi:hypothetical protein
MVAVHVCTGLYSPILSTGNTFTICRSGGGGVGWNGGYWREWCLVVVCFVSEVAVETKGEQPALMQP